MPVFFNVKIEIVSVESEGVCSVATNNFHLKNTKEKPILLIVLLLCKKSVEFEYIALESIVIK